ncbi:MAG: 3'(2'),5'-bisphosphate nucleotidase CysQ [Nitrospiraceae bacterium]|jgi:3'(2'), 5'-bisphosphate nucleotidase|nr:MAG: 3'(2'),5'-bisphosphate nucleotidase CysQ [Nitrospiraceae bacterium]
MPAINYNHSISFLPHLLSASQKAGDAIMEIYQTDFAVEEKDDRSPLTLADKRSHRIICDHLKAISDKTIPIISEEGKDVLFNKRTAWEYFWLVDPLDGTKEFIKRNDEFTVNIALVCRNRPVFGIIYIPAKEIYYFGAQGAGSYKFNDKKIISRLRNRSVDQEKLLTPEDILSCSSRLPLDKDVNVTAKKFTVIGSRSHASQETEIFLNAFRIKYGEFERISAGSSLKFCLVAEGRADLYPRFGPTMEWDTAAGQVIVEQAGGRVVSIEDKLPLRYNKESLVNPSFIVQLHKNLNIF